MPTDGNQPMPIFTHMQHQGLGYNLFRAICFPWQISRGKVPGQKPLATTMAGK